MPDLDLTGARLLAEGYLSDACQVYRDTPGYHDDVLDINTGTLAPAPGDTTLLWEGACRFSPTGVGQSVEGARVSERRGYRARLPWGAPTVLRNDRVVVTESLDPRLVGKNLRVTEATQGGSYRVLTTLILEEYEPVGPA